MKYNPDKSVLSPTKDMQLIRNVQQYAEAAGLGGSPHFIWESIKDRKYVSKTELRAMSKLDDMIEDEMFGVYWDEGSHTITKKFMALTGLLTRNYVNSCFMPMSDLTSILMKDQHPVHRCIFVPDFFIHSGDKAKSKTKEVPDWKKDMIMSFLMKRLANGQLTFIYASNFKKMKAAYGEDITNFIEENYMHMEQGE